jgi:hypothetical protein
MLLATQNARITGIFGWQNQIGLLFMSLLICGFPGSAA